MLCFVSFMLKTVKMCIACFFLILLFKCHFYLFCQNEYRTVDRWVHRSFSSYNLIPISDWRSVGWPEASRIFDHLVIRWGDERTFSELNLFTVHPNMHSSMIYFFLTVIIPDSKPDGLYLGPAIAQCTSSFYPTRNNKPVTHSTRSADIHSETSGWSDKTRVPSHENSLSLYVDVWASRELVFFHQLFFFHSLAKAQWEQIVAFFKKNK